MNMIQSVECTDSLLVQKMAKFTIDDTSDEFVFHDIAPINVPLYFTCYIKSEQTGMVLIQGNIVETSPNWVHVEVPCITSDGNVKIRFTTQGVYYMKENQLEISTIPSTYIPSSDDYMTEVQVTSVINQTASQIQLSVAESYYDKETVESLINIEKDRIDLIVEDKTDKNAIISAINLSPELIKISSEKIDIVGLVSIINEDDDTQTNISGNKIRTGVIVSDNYAYSGGSFTDDGIIIDLENSVIRSKFFKTDETSLEVVGTINATGGTFGTTNPFVIGDNGFSGTKIGTTSTGTYTVEKSESVDSNTVTFRIAGSGNDTVNDINLNLGTVKLAVQYSYTIYSTTSTTKVDDITESSETEDEQLPTEGGTGSTSSGSITTSQTITNTAILTLRNSVSTVIPTVSIIDGVKTYSYTYSITSGTLSNFIENRVSLPSSYSNFSVTSCIATAVFSYNFSSYATYSHIGTDYFLYDGFRIQNGINTFNTPVVINNSLQVKDYINFNSNTSGTIYSPKFMITGDTKSLVFSSQPTYSGGGIVFKKYAYGGNYNSVSYSLTLLDDNGNTILPNKLYASYIYPNANVSGDTLNLMSQKIQFDGVEFACGKNTDTNEKRVRFTQSSYSGSYRHDAYLYGGNGDSQTAIGCYNAKDSKCIWYYRDTNDRMYIYNLFFKDWGGTFRKPVASVTADSYRVQYIGSRSAGLYAYGQWGVTNARFSKKYFNSSSSDIRLKENIKNTEIKNALNVIDKMQLYSYDWKDYDDTIPKHQKIGFIADKLEEIDKRLTIGGGYDKDGNMDIKSIDTLYLLSYIVKGIQELKEEVDKLKKGE